MIRKIKLIRKNYILMSAIAMLTLVMGLTYAVFVISSDSYRASEMYIGNLLYGIEITNEDDTTDNINNLTVTLSPNEERTIKVKVNSLNPVDSKYKLQYITSNNIEVKYSSDTPNPVIGDIEKENNPNDEVEIYIYLKNNENANVTITFGVKGGYNHNTSTSIELLPSYLAIIDEYTERDLILAITIDGNVTGNLPTTGYYSLDNYACENNSVLEWSAIKKKLTTTTYNFPEKCNLNFVTINGTPPEEIDYTTIMRYTGAMQDVSNSTYYMYKFLTSGTLTLSETKTIDVFLVGGGGSGNGGGGGGGYTTTIKNVTINKTIPTSVVIGEGGSYAKAHINSNTSLVNGGATFFGSYSANGGQGIYYFDSGSIGGGGGAGGSGGGGSIYSDSWSFIAFAGGSDGGNGGGIYGGTGQGTTTRAFGEATGELFSGGGGASGYAGTQYYNSSNSGGAGGGGGCSRGTNISTDGAQNTGGGGGGAGGSGGYDFIGSGSGGSGIAIIRWPK